MSESVRRAAGILDSLATRPKTVVQLAADFGLHRSTMFREMRTLEEVGYVRRRIDGTYALSFHVVALAQSVLENLDLRQAAHDVARRLHQVVGNTVHVAALVDDAIIYVDKVEDSGGVRMYSRIGSPVRPHCSALGKVVLAGLDPARRDAVLAGTRWRRYTQTTLGSRTALDEQLLAVADRGWAVDDGEFESFVNCVAVPITSTTGVVGALSLTAIRAVQDLSQLTARIPLMQRAAAQIGREFH